MTNKNWFIATVLVFVTICAWVVFDILHITSEVEIPPETSKLIEPINPEFNTQVLDS